MPLWKSVHRCFRDGSHRMTTSQEISPVRLERDDRVGVVVIDNPPVNAGSAAVRKGILDAIHIVSQDPALDAAVLIGAGKTFISGSDIREFGRPLSDPQLPAVIAAIEACPKPVVAALHGSALGGGFELALACDARIAALGTLVGLPEVKLGIIPGAGGTQRLPRLVGIASAIEIITSARRVPANEALSLGMIDRIAEGELRTDAVAFALSKRGKRPLDEVPVPAEPFEMIETAAATAMKKGKGRPAVEQAIHAIRLTASLPFSEGLAKERQVFQQLRVSDEAAALRHLFFAEREASRVPAIEGCKPGSVELVGVIGAGTMGAGITLAFADAGIPVLMVERDEDALARGVKRVRENYDRLVSTGRISPQQAEKRLSLIRPGLDFAALADADLLIEAVFEDMSVKQALLRTLDTLVRPNAILASNTSYLNLDVMARATALPERVVGLHFFSPANVMRLLEVVQGAETAPDVLATALAVGKRIGKISVVAQVGEGFIGNRIYYAYRNQCEFMLEEGAYPEEVDAALEAFGFAMGPFAVGDLSGLDIAWRTRQRLAETRDPRMRYPDILDKLCEAGSFGQKAGRGWYRYEPNKRKGVPSDEARYLIEDASTRKNITRRKFAEQEIIARALGAMVNEAVLLLAEGIAQRPSDVDLAMVHGYGFPNYRGGPLFWASRQPRREITAALAAVQKATGFGFRRADVESVLDKMAIG